MLPAKLSLEALGVFCLLAGGAISGEPALAEEPRLFVSSEYFTFGGADYFTAAVVLADIDGDGDLDAVMVNGRHWARQDLVLLNNGSGRFLSAHRLGDALATGYQPAVADLNHDGRPDIIVSRDRVRSRIFINTGANAGKGYFKDAGPVGPTGPTRAVAAADIDRDGEIDLIFSLRGMANRIAYGPDFERTTGLGPPEQTVRLAVGDLNGDGFPDLVFANLGAEGNYLHLSDGSGGFAPVLRLDSALTRSVDVAVGDINGDGQPDVVFARVGQNVIFLNDPRHRFARKIMFGMADARSYGIALGDFDRDGRTDIAIANAGGANALFMNRPASLIRVDLPEDPDALSYGVSIGDLDGNGFPDLVFANSGSKSRIYLNVTEEEAEAALSR